MIWTRKLGKLIGGKATSFQVAAGALFGAWVGFLPEFGAAPGLVVAVWAGLAVVNANLIVAAAVGVGAKLLSLAALPVSFQAGRWAIDGPTSGLFERAINAPVLAWFGLERYTTTGGMIVGTGVGVVAATLAVVGLGRLRRGLAALSSDSEKFRAFAERKPVRVASLVLLGRSRPTLEDVPTKRVGNPVRPLGAGLVVGAGALAFGLQALLGSSFAETQVRRGLERANGATVDLAGLQLDLGGGRVAVERLALADAERLEFDLFRGLAFEADVDTSELLRGRVVIEKLVVREAQTDARRERPGALIEAAPRPPRADDEVELQGEERRLEDYLADAEVWRERLERARVWIERLAPSGGDSAAEAHRDETLAERLERRATESGLREVRATHRIAQAPRWVVRELVIEGLALGAFEDRPVSLHATGLSSAPALFGAGPQFSLRTDDGAAELALGFDPDGAGRVDFALRGLEVDALTRGLSVRGVRPIEGGRIDVALAGGWRGGEAGRIDLPLDVSVFDTRLNLGALGATEIERFGLPIALRGPLDAPAIRVEDDELVASLLAAGKTRLADAVRAEAEARIAAARKELRAGADALMAEHLVDGLGLDGAQVGRLADALESGDLDGAGDVVAEVARAEAEQHLAPVAEQVQDQVAEAQGKLSEAEQLARQRAAEAQAALAAAEAQARARAQAEAAAARAALEQEAKSKAKGLLGGWLGGQKP